MKADNNIENIREWDISHNSHPTAITFSDLIHVRMAIRTLEQNRGRDPQGQLEGRRDREGPVVGQVLPCVKRLGTRARPAFCHTRRRIKIKKIPAHRNPHNKRSARRIASFLNTVLCVYSREEFLCAID